MTPEQHTNVLEALRTGHELAVEHAAETHLKYAGSRPHRHAAADEDVRSISEAIAIMEAELTQGATGHVLMKEIRGDKSAHAGVLETALPAPIADHIEDVRSMVPEGWQLVPVEPTPEMLSAIWAYKDDSLVNGYRAMIAAAPKGEI